MKSQERHPAPISRRKLVGLSLASALAGGIWTTGFAVLARGVHPQFLAIGDDAWQVVLIEHGQRRALIGLGLFDTHVLDYVPGLTTSLRQHIDIVIGESGFLEGLSPLSGQWANAVRVQLDGSAFAAGSPTYLHLRDQITIGLGEITLTLRGLPSGEWNRENTIPPGWIGHLRHGHVTVAMSSSLDVAAEHARPESALAIAPGGDFSRTQRLLPATGIVTNSSSVPDDAIAKRGPGSTVLVRTFRADVASFRIREGKIELPGWTQHIDRYAPELSTGAR